MYLSHFGDIQCAIPCFEGLFPSPDNEHIMSLLYVLAYWHGLSKMQMHTESSVKLLDDAHTVLGTHLRHFEQVVCAKYTTRETEKEYTKRVRAEARNVKISTAHATHSAGSRQPQVFKLSTIKTHLLGYYPYYIRLYGTIEMLSTMMVCLALCLHHLFVRLTMYSPGRTGASSCESPQRSHKRA
jgi:hypothetical protein